VHPAPDVPVGGSGGVARRGRAGAVVARRPVAIAGAAVLTLAVIVVVATYRDYGVTWDEGVQARYGELVVDYFRSGLRDRRADDFLSLRIYGPVFEAGAAIASGILPLPKWELRHLLTALVGLLAVPGLLGCARALREPWVGPAAAVALLTMPRFWGDLFANSKDIPFAAAFTAAMAALAALACGPGRPPRRVLIAGLAIGGAAAVRPGGLPLLAAVLLVALALSIRVEPTPRATAGAAVDALAKGALALAIAWLVMTAFWPWAHVAPLRHPIQAMANAASLAKVYPVLFEGRVLPSNQLPARYVAEFLLITTPLPLLALAAVGCIVAVRRQWRAPTSAASRTLLLFELWWLGPIVAATIVRPNVYDGLRHFLFVLPAVALFAGLAAVAIATAPRRAAARASIVALLCVALLWPLRALVGLHPYQYTYFNELVGGLAGASGRYETDYWVASYREAMLWIQDPARARPGRPLRVLVAANELSFTAAEAYAGPGVELVRLTGPPLGVRLPDGFDYFVATYRHGMNAAFPGAPVVHEVGRDGAVFTTIKAGA
jgi:hypothetical protein